MEEEFKKDNKILRIFRDENPESPREWDNLGKMICFHNSHNLGDETDLDSENFEGWEELEKYLINELKAVIIKPLYLYDHSGITIKTTPFGCRWDSGQIGFIYVTSEDIKNNFGEDTPENRKKSEDILINEVKTYDEYLTGDVYGFTLNELKSVKIKKEYENGEVKEFEEVEEEETDSCWGYFGDEGIKQIKEENNF